MATEPGAKTLVVGHRGNPARFPDNSIQGILDARSVADMVEIDVRRTADGILVLSHDAHIGDRVIVESDYESFPGLDRFTDLLDAIGSFPLNIEIKNWPADPDFDPSLETARRIADHARPIDLITSFHWPTVEAVRATRPDVPTGLLINGGGRIDEALAAARTGGHEAVAPHWSLIEDPDLVMAAAGGLSVIAWTVNDDSVARRLIDGGITAVISDDPARMRELVEETP